MYISTTIQLSKTRKWIFMLNQFESSPFLWLQYPLYLYFYLFVISCAIFSSCKKTKFELGRKGYKVYRITKKYELASKEEK